MQKVRKMLGRADSPYILSIMKLIETQSKVTLANWAISYAESEIMPIYLKHYPNDDRLKITIESARSWLRGEVKLPEVKSNILNLCHMAARESESCPPAQAAARAIGQACSTIHAATHSLGVCFYGAAAIAYDRVGVNKTAEEYDIIAAEACQRMENALRAVAVSSEQNIAKINWRC